MALAAIAGGARLLSGHWLAPVAFFPLCWTAYVGVAVLFAGSFPLYAPGLWVIVWLVFACAVGGMVVTRPAVTPSERPPYPDFAAERVICDRALLATVFFTLTAGAGVVLLFVLGISSFGLSLGPEALLLLGHEYSVSRYGGGEIELPTIVVLLFYWTWPAAVLGGVTFAMTRQRTRRLVALLPLLLALVSALIQARRSVVLTAAALWAAAVLAVSVAREGRASHLFRVGWVATGTVAGVFFVLLYAFLQWLRGAFSGSFDVFGYGFGAVEAFFGSVSVFTHWYRSAEPADPSWGALTFAGLFDLLQLAERRQGIYETFVYFAWGSSSNVYTMFRGLIEDFGYVGAWLACFGVGMGSTVAYRKCMSGLLTWTVPLSMFYASALYSLIVSTFVNNSVIVGWVIAGLVLISPQSKRKSPELLTPS